MKRNNLLFLLVIIIGTISFTNCKKDKDEKLKIGQEYEGGIIFYLDGSEKHGMVCAKSDQSTNAFWYNVIYEQSNANGSAVGTGQSNTSTIVTAFGDGNYAAKACNDLTLNGYSDWFLPSFDELMLMNTNLSEAGMGGFSINNYYWSSTQLVGNTGGAKSLQFFDHQSSSHNYQTNYETATARVRAARVF